MISIYLIFLIPHHKIDDQCFWTLKRVPFINIQDEDILGSHSEVDWASGPGKEYGIF